LEQKLEAKTIQHFRKFHKLPDFTICLQRVHSERYDSRVRNGNTLNFLDKTMRVSIHSKVKVDGKIVLSLGVQDRLKVCQN
jgi:hypothetical protein